MEFDPPTRAGQGVNRVADRILPVKAMAERSQPVELEKREFAAPDPGGSFGHHLLHLADAVGRQAEVFTGVRERGGEMAQDLEVEPPAHHFHRPHLIAQSAPLGIKE